MLEKSLHQHPPVLQVGVQGGVVEVRATPVQLAVLHLVHVRTPIGHWEAARENNNIILKTKNMSKPSGAALKLWNVYLLPVILFGPAASWTYFEQHKQTSHG